MAREAAGRRSGFSRLVRRSGIRAARLTRGLGLPNLFLIVAVLVVAIAMIVLGNWLGGYLATSISRGVAETAASSIDSLIANSVDRLGPERPVGASDAAQLDEVFRIGNEAESTRLLQIRIRDLNGQIIYASFGGIIGSENPDDFTAAASGEIVSRVSDLPLEAVGPFGPHGLSVLEIHTPLHNPRTDELFAVADLYYSARSVLQIQREAQLAVWLLVGMAGLGVITALYVFVRRVSRTIDTQRLTLARNLEASRRLAEENLTLHAASERLRVDAALSNEGLLAGVGSDLHDGPIQLLALIILRLSKSAKQAEGALALSLQESVGLATDAMEELRNISAGLVLPELADLTLEETIALSIRRHEAATGKLVEKRIAPPLPEAPMTVKICVYRIVQEALNNAFWHGDRSSPRVVARLEGERLHLEVINNARLKSTADLRRNDPASIGLRSMRFRVEALGGTLRFGMATQSEAAIAADIPIDATAAQRTSSVGEKIGAR
jgi:signal transduction histidine kinase